MVLVGVRSSTTTMAFLTGRHRRNRRFSLRIDFDSQDHLDSQKWRGYAERLHELNTEGCFGPAGKTEHWQPLDRGHIGAI